MNQWKQIALSIKQNNKILDLIDETELLNDPNFKIQYRLNILKPKKQRPIEPQQPDPDECCGSGCQRCVLEVYYEKLEQYEKDLMDWLEEQQENDENTNNCE